MLTFLSSPASVASSLSMDNLSIFFLFHPARELTNLFSWDSHCVATNTTNGVDRRTAPSTSKSLAYAGLSKLAAGIASDPDLPSPFTPTLQQLGGSTDLMKSFVLPGNKTGVVRDHRVFDLLITGAHW